MANPYNNNTWNAWTNKSKEVSFKSTEQAVGDGEHKLGAEYDVKPQGQNVSYDLDILGEKWEVKKLDSDNSFRLGVEVSSNYRQVIDCVTRILEQVLNLETILVNSTVSNQIEQCINDIKTSSGRSTTLLIEGLTKNEVSSSNLDKANKIIEILKKLIITENKKVVLYSSFNGSIKTYDVLTAFNKLEFENISIEDKLNKLNCNLEFYSRLQLTATIKNDILVFKDEPLKEKLNKLVRSVFTDIKLVLVHEQNGYKPITDMNLIYCNRITSGNPRCKLY